LDVALRKETLARKQADHATRTARWLAIAASLLALGARAALVVAYKSHLAELKASTEVEKQKGLVIEITRGHAMAAVRERDAITAALNLQKRSDPLIGLINSGEKELTGTGARVR